MRRVRRPWLLLVVGVLACFAWVALRTDGDSDLTCVTYARGRIDCTTPDP